MLGAPQLSICVPVINLVKFAAIVTLNISSAPFSFFAPSGIPRYLL